MQRAAGRGNEGRSAAQVHLEVSHSAKINLHPLRATSRARFRPSSVSACCTGESAHAHIPRVQLMTRVLGVTFVGARRTDECTEVRGGRRPGRVRDGERAQNFPRLTPFTSSTTTSSTTTSPPKKINPKTFGCFLARQITLMNDLHILQPY